MYIFWVEDDDDIREALHLLLQDAGYVAKFARDGYAALEMLRTEYPKPGLIFFDLAMPIMNGFEFREAQLQDADLCDIPVVCVSAMHMTQWVKDKLGADAYLTKPLHMDTLLELIAVFAACEKDPPPKIRDTKKNPYI